MKRQRCRLQLRVQLANQIHAARPICQFYARGRPCYSGLKCPFKHKLKIKHRFEVPFIHVHRALNGSVGVRLRPPLNEAFKTYFVTRDASHRWVESSRQLTEEVCMFSLPNMAAPDMLAVADAKLTGHGHTSTGRNPGQVSGHALPKCWCHGTTIECALAIIRAGSANTSQSICGRGVYSLASEGYSDAELLTTFHRLSLDGYNRGAVLVMEPAGILVRIKPDEVVPLGCTSINKRGANASHHYSSHPGTLTYRYLIVNVAGLVEKLNREPSRFGYNTELH